ANGEPLRLPERRQGTTDVLLEENSLGRRIVFKKARDGVMKKTKGRYPAPLAAIDAIQRGYTDGFDAGLKEEAERFGTLTVSPESHALVSLFFATTALKKDTGLPDGVHATPRAIHKVGVLGAGFMGAGITTVAVQAGSLVRLKDESAERLASGWRAVRDVVRERVRKRQITRVQMDDTMSRIGVTTNYSGFANTQLVIEAVFEDLAVKQQVVREIDAVAPSVIIASNTSTIPIRDIAAVAQRPDRVVGMHFFSPVEKMPLLEVIVTPQTSAETTATAVHYGRQLGKTVIVVRDGPGFYVNRILAPYLNEAGTLLDEGVSIEAIDDALTSFGFPVGPITLLDEVGLDIAGKSAPILAEAFGARMQPSRALRRVIESGRLGRKSKRGFYRYDDSGKRLGPDHEVYALSVNGSSRRTMDAAEIQRRTVLPMLNEAVRCLDEGVIRSARDGDIGAVFGIGFPPFLGGPFRFIDANGAAAIVEQLMALDAKSPGRFAPSDRLRDMAAQGERFHL
ncbi:MAG: fatty acid oxidation complex subunit alpha FadJ, partial [Gemmatimonadaceae bacterium]|nr:fatty acid oxidation complex subunit alpha FadJ [Gemmatimonadaceae bacterium]